MADNQIQINGSKLLSVFISTIRLNRGIEPSFAADRTDNTV